MAFSVEDVAKLTAEHAVIAEQYQALASAYVCHSYKDSRAREFATQGFSRRLKTLVRCIDIVFEKIPPTRNSLPSEDERTDAVIAIQAFVFNLFGSIDNLAWIWVHEKKVTNKDGLPLRPTLVGLGPRNVLVRDSLPATFRAYLDSLQQWFEHLEDYRHALAHRIPLYIPPYVVHPSNEQAYRDLIVRQDEALDRGAAEDYELLSIELTKVVKFRPWISHSFEERSTPVAFHPQLLVDFKTLVEISNMMKRAI
jgi:hypothetical protein